MSTRIVRVQALHKYRVHLWFADGVNGVVDLAHLAGRGVFTVWDQPGFFEKASVHPELHTLTWPGELDLDPFVLRSAITGEALPGSDAPTRAAS